MTIAVAPSELRKLFRRKIRTRMGAVSKGEKKALLPWPTARWPARRHHKDAHPTPHGQNQGGKKKKENGLGGLQRLANATPPEMLKGSS
jgi:hypothetical protein